MDVLWKYVSDIDTFVKTTLSKEAEDIPQERIEKLSWYLDTVSLVEIRVNQEMLEEHDTNPIHIKRRDTFISAITEGREILPLIVLGENCYLVDGYARYRALKSLVIEQVKVFKQRVD